MQLNLFRQKANFISDLSDWLQLGLLGDLDVGGDRETPLQLRWSEATQTGEIFSSAHTLSFSVMVMAVSTF
jgi:hypothetical protein